MKDVQFMSAAEKRRVLRHWELFLKGGCKFTQFTKALYNHLIMHCSFIAHYNIAGFYATYFESGDDTRRFLRQFDNRDGIPSSIEYGMICWYTDSDYNDINSEMCRIAVKYIDGLVSRADAAQEAADLVEVNRLLAKHGRRQVRVG